MSRLRSASYLLRRVRQTPALFTNFGSVFVDLGAQATPWSRPELTFRLRNGYVVHCPNVPGARFPLYEIFGDDAYRMAELLDGVDDDAGVLDVGGQIGSFSLAVAAELPKARVHVYEASPTSASYIRRNVEGNDLDGRVTVHGAAMAGEAGEFSFVDSGTASGHNGLTAPDAVGTEVTVPAVTFDEAAARVAADGSAVQLVKMDVEGAEYDIVLRSSPDSWREVRSVVMEYHPVPGRHLDDLLEFFAAVGLTPSRMEPGTLPGLGVMWLSRRGA